MAGLPTDLKVSPTGKLGIRLAQLKARVEMELSPTELKAARLRSRQMLLRYLTYSLQCRKASPLCQRSG